MSEKHWTENFRIFTPILVTIAIFMLGNLMSTTKDIDDKLFKHLTNDDMHVIRSTVVTKAEFDIVSKMREAQFNRIENELSNLNNTINRRLEKTDKGG